MAIDDDGENALGKFENLAKKLFASAKADVIKAEEIAEEAVDELLADKPEAKPPES